MAQTPQTQAAVIQNDIRSSSRFEFPLDRHIDASSGNFASIVWRRIIRAERSPARKHFACQRPDFSPILRPGKPVEMRPQ